MCIENKFAPTDVTFRRFYRIYTTYLKVFDDNI